jgi:tetratricopeptide (TPR) repeat protein
MKFLFLILLLNGLGWCSQKGSRIVTAPVEYYELIAREKELVEKIERTTGDTRHETLSLAEIRYVLALMLRDNAGKNINSEAYEKALLYAESAALLAHNNPDFWILYGSMLLDWPELSEAQYMAEEVFRTAMNYRPGYDLEMLIGQTLYNRQRFSDALEYWESAYMGNPELVTPARIYLLNTAYLLAGDPEAGVVFYEQLLPVSGLRADVHLCRLILLKALYDNSFLPYWLTELRKGMAEWSGFSQVPEETVNYAKGLFAKWTKELK